MATRPTVGGSDGTWGTELNEHLDVSLDADGKVDDGAAQTTSAAPGADAELANKKYVDDTYLTGQTVQVAHTQTGAVNTGTIAMPDDDTIPQITEGDEYMTLAITPDSATNKLLIEVVMNISPGAGGIIGVALFQDTTAGALAAVREQTAILQSFVIPLRHYMTAGTTSSTTFRIRAGGTSGTTTFNGLAGTRKYGGVLASSITITEIKV